MAVSITVTLAGDELLALNTAGYTQLKLFRGAWTWGKVGLGFDYTTATYTWTISAGDLVKAAAGESVSYTYEDTTGDADSVYDWAPYGAAPGLGPVRAAFEPKTVRAASLIVDLAKVVDPMHFVHSTLTGFTDADTFADTKITQADDFYNGLWLLMLSGARKAQGRQIEDWTQTGGVWELTVGLSGSPAAADEYLVLPFEPEAAFEAIRGAIVSLWPRRAQRITDRSLAGVSGEQEYDIPPPLRIVEAVEYVTLGSSVPVSLPFEQGEDTFRLTFGGPGAGTVLRVTGLAPFSLPYELDSVIEMAHPQETRDVLAEAELLLRLDPTSGLAPDADRIARLAQLREATQRPYAKQRTIVIEPMVM